MVRSPSESRCLLLRLNDQNGDCRAMVPIKGDQFMDLLGVLTQARDELNN